MARVIATFLAAAERFQMFRMLLLATLLLWSAGAHSDELKAEFCPNPDLPVKFTVTGAALIIERADDRAFCVPSEGITFACIETKLKAGEENEYFVKAQIIDDSVLYFEPPGDTGPMLISRCE